MEYHDLTVVNSSCWHMLNRTVHAIVGLHGGLCSASRCFKDLSQPEQAALNRGPQRATWKCVYIPVSRS